MKPVRHLIERYLTDTRGQFAVWFAILSVPLLVEVGIAVDMQKATSNKSAVKNALDTAVLAAVSNSQNNRQQTEIFAKEVFANTLNIEITVGHFLDKNIGADSINNFMVNETFEQKYNIETAISKRIKCTSNDAY